MKLYEIPRGSKIKITDDKDKELIVTFHHLDGMYSYCTLDGGKGTIHLSASTPLKKVGKYYKIQGI